MAITRSSTSHLSPFPRPSTGQHTSDKQGVRPEERQIVLLYYANTKRNQGVITPTDGNAHLLQQAKGCLNRNTCACLLSSILFGNTAQKIKIISGRERHTVTPWYILKNSLMKTQKTEPIVLAMQRRNMQPCAPLIVIHTRICIVRIPAHVRGQCSIWGLALSRA